MKFKRTTETAAGCGLCLLMMIVGACSPVASPTKSSSTNSTTNSTSAPKTSDAPSRVQKVKDVPDGTGAYNLWFASDRGFLLGDTKKLWRTSEGVENWELVYAADTEAQNITDVHFDDLQSGWMLRPSGLYKTEDSGRTWTLMTVTPLSYPKGDGRAVKFMEKGRTGWLAGGIYKAVSPKELEKGFPNNAIDPVTRQVLYGAIFRTDDGGVTWRRQSFPESVGRVLDLFFLDKEHGLALGSAGVFYTANGGELWSRVKFKDECVNQEFLDSSEGRPTDVYFVDSKTGWLSFDDGYIAKSTDGGRSWCDLLLPGDTASKEAYHTFLNSIHFVDLTHGWALGGDGNLYESENSGAKWVKTNVKIRFDGMYFANSTQGWIVSKEGLFRIAL